jgi:hypothetical protein
VFSDRTIHIIKQKVYEYILRKLNKKIVPSDRVVTSALYGVYYDHRPNTGDIYGKYLVVDEMQRDDYSSILDKTISLLIDGICTDIEMQEANSKLNIWDATILGDFNKNGLVNLNQTNFIMFHKVSGSLIDKSLANLSKFVDVYYSTEY